MGFLSGKITSMEGKTLLFEGSTLSKEKSCDFVETTSWQATRPQKCNLVTCQ